MDRTILSLCDYSGNWSEPYKNAGYNVIKIDLKFGDDVRLLKFQENIYGVLAAPPCDDFSSAGAQYWGQKGDKALLNSLSIVDSCMRIILSCKPYFWALENPVGRLSEYLGKPQLVFHPYYYGDTFKKRTCLWGDFKNPIENRVVPTYSLTEKFKDKESRSNTSKAFANAFFEVNR